MISLSRSLRRKGFLLLVLIGVLVTVRYLIMTTGVMKQHNFLNKLRSNIWSTDLSDPGLSLSLRTTEDPLNKQRREVVKQMTREAWQAYVKYAWGANELSPVSKVPRNSGMLGNNLGLTIIDSLDTLWLMGLTKEYQQARMWVKEKFNIKKFDFDISVFETTIRLLGGFLSAYALTGDFLYVKRAQQVADVLMPAFDTRSGIPAPMVFTRSGDTHFHGWVPGASCTVLADMGSLHMEFTYLTEVTGNRKYANAVNRSRYALLQGIHSPDGLYPTSISTLTGEGCDATFTLGALGDSFYEYNLKEFLRSGDLLSLQMYRKSLVGISKHLLGGFDIGNGFLCAGKDTDLSNKDCVMEHLTCFSGGMFALGNPLSRGIPVYGDKSPHAWMSVGKNVTRTCFEAYRSTATGLSGDKFRLSGKGTLQSLDPTNKLRPETVESLFVLWRLTGETKYRDWGWRITQAFRHFSRVPNKTRKSEHVKSRRWRRVISRGGHGNTLSEYSSIHIDDVTPPTDETSGYSGIDDVGDAHQRNYDDTQQSFFLAETLKYLYLLFSNNDVLPLDKWVFNTEAHPLPVTVNVSTTTSADYWLSLLRSHPPRTPSRKSTRSRTKSRSKVPAAVTVTSGTSVT